MPEIIIRGAQLIITSFLILTFITLKNLFPIIIATNIADARIIPYQYIGKLKTLNATEDGAGIIIITLQVSLLFVYPNRTDGLLFFESVLEQKLYPLH